MWNYTNACSTLYVLQLRDFVRSIRFSICFVVILANHDGCDLRQVAAEAGDWGYWLKNEVANLPPKKLLSIVEE